MADEGEYPYATVPNTLRELLARLPSIGKEKATQAWLQSLGYTSSNDRSCLTAIRKAGIIGAGGEPTDFWTAIRARDGQKVAEYVRAAYRDLFTTYPDADKRDDETLQSFFRSKTTG